MSDEHKQIDPSDFVNRLGDDRNRLEKELAMAVNDRDRLRAELDRWLKWSDGNHPDESPGDVIEAFDGGYIMLDDGTPTWNPLRALAFVSASREELRAELDAVTKEIRILKLHTSAIKLNEDAAISQPKEQK